MEVDTGNGATAAEQEEGSEEEDEEDEDRLDVVWTEGGRMVALDVAIVGAHSDQGRLQAETSRDGVAARRSETAKRTRYEGLPITPFVFEVGGRPGLAAIGVVRALAARAGNDASQEAAILWQKLSIALQTGVGRTVVTGLVAPPAVSVAGAA